MSFKFCTVQNWFGFYISVYIQPVLKTDLCYINLVTSLCPALVPSLMCRLPDHWKCIQPIPSLLVSHGDLRAGVGDWAAMAMHFFHVCLRAVEECGRA